MGRYLLRRVWQELQTQAQDQTAREIFNRIAGWHPDMRRPGRRPAVRRRSRGTHATADVAGGALAAEGFRASLFSTLTTLGIPQDVTLQEMRIECFSPADDASRAALEALSKRTSESPPPPVPTGAWLLAAHEVAHGIGS
ncbi:MmyB family transcriptional regulator [Cupriavidus basilensis]